MALTTDQINRYSRHLLLPEVGVEGQEKICNAKVLLIGTGGLGSPLALYLAAAGVGTLGLIDFDVRDYQKDMIDRFHNERFVICKMARQSGKSTTILAYLLHYILFNENVSVAVLANKKATAMELLGRLQLA